MLEQVCALVGAVWLFLGAACLIIIVAGNIGTRIARHRGRQCPYCDYRASQLDLILHRVREHERD